MRPHRSIVFAYKPAAGKLSPMASMGIRLNGRWSVAEMYVDSGAFYTLMHSQFARDFGFDFKQGRKIFVQVGDGSLIPVYLHRVLLQIGPKLFQATVGFSEKLGVRFHLLGRQDVFEHFTICFHEHRRMISFRPIG